MCTLNNHQLWSRNIYDHELTIMRNMNQIKTFSRSLVVNLTVLMIYGDLTGLI